MSMKELLIGAKMASRQFLNADEQTRNRALLAVADALMEYTNDILDANALDIQKALGTMSDVMIDRLRLTVDRIAEIAQGVRNVAALPDPLSRSLQTVVRPNGLTIEKVCVPLGVVAIIYESRPNVTVDAAALCIKSGNVCILRGGKNAYCTNVQLLKIIKEAIASVGLNERVVNMPEDTSRESALALMTAVGYVDVLIPRGGAGLIRSCVEQAKVPCIQTGTGICHVYVDESAELEQALKIVENAKTSRPSVCNAQEVCLVHRAIANEYLPRLKALLCDQRIAQGKTPVEFRLCEQSRAIIEGSAATDDDFDTEFLDYILAVKIVDSVDQAIQHIALHSTGHSDAIVATNPVTIEKFVRSVDSAAVYVNASTRFTDGGEFGKGCEIGISTQKMHARGPMGLEELTTYKYVVYGDGQVR